MRVHFLEIQPHFAMLIRIRISTGIPREAGIFLILLLR